MLKDQRLKIKAPEIEYVLNTLLKYAVGKEGALISFYDAQNGHPIDTSPIIEDFGDIAPFLWICGDQAFAKKEFATVRSTLDRDMLHINPRRRSRMIHTYDWTDLLLGLIEYNNISGEKSALDITQQIFDLWNAAFYCRNGVSGQAIKFYNRLYVLPISRLLDISMFPELLLRYAECLEPEPAEKMQGRAFSMISQWIQTNFYKETGLFSDTIISQNPLRAFIEIVISIGTRRYETHHVCTLFKHNTNALASILAVWKQTRDPTLLQIIEHWVHGCCMHLLTSENMVVMRWHKSKGVLQGPTDHNFQVIDLMCDIAYETKNEQYLDLATSIANAWIKIQSPIGFMPHHITGARSQQAMSDSQTDFAVALLKLAVLTDNKSYTFAAEKIMSAVKKYMYLPCGMATWVDVNTGILLNSTCKTKFMALSLKAWLALNNQERIYKDEQFTNILSDR